MRSGTLTLRIDSQLDQVFLIGLSVRAIGAAAGLDHEEAGAVELCVVEAVNNAIEHAYREQPGSVVEVEMALAATALRIEVRDRGRRMDWAAACALPDAHAAEHLAEGGRGVLIMRSLMDGLSYHTADGWNVLRMVKQLPSADALAAESQRST